jgi:hypothetical protein
VTLARRRGRFKNKLLSLDATAISLCLNLFPREAEPRGEDRCRNDRERPSEPDLDGPTGTPDPQVAPLLRPRRLVPVCRCTLSRLDLFTYSDLSQWCENPFETPLLVSPLLRSPADSCLFEMLTIALRLPTRGVLGQQWY